MEIAANIQRLHTELPDGVRIVAVTKTRTTGEVMELYKSGHRLMGENRVQELLAKREELPGDIEWHMVGHLQTNKVKYIAPFVSLIHSVDSQKLLRTVSKEALKNKRVIDVLLQVHIADEETKFGFSEEEVTGLAEGFSAADYPGARLRGLMGMATFTEDVVKVRSEFRRLASIFRNLQDILGSGAEDFDELSMGMSGDYQVAVGEGSTLVRIGSLIFGERE
ncbi:MAG: YggS family pyridoxal phosphate-dependent enzyme [Marinilabiliales bacterium]|nr:MAG: YggS family pyridoxal phosphate-dependent enzyme [Marinilabiliales bacterium]